MKTKGTFTVAGFTLIELLIVVGIIAILAAIAVPNFLEAQVWAKVSRTKADIRTIAVGMEAYAADNNKYPPNFDTGLYTPNTTSEYLTYAMLTTPVAFLSSTPVDIFGPSTDQPERELYFDYIGYDTVSQQPSVYGAQAQAYWGEKGLKWVIISRGPDKHFNLLANLHQASTLMYDPTNGTVSRGDIARTNHGQVVP